MAEREEVIIDVTVEGANQAESQMNELTESIKETGDATEETNKDTKEYSKTLGDTAKEVKVFGVSMNSLSSAFSNSVGAIRNSVTGLKAFKIALAATGIGLLIVALGSLATFLTKSQKGMDLVTKATDFLTAAFDVLIKRLVSFGEGMANFFSGEFRLGIQQMGDAFKDMGEEIAITTAASFALSDAQAILEQQQIDFIVREAELRAIRKEENADAEDITRSLRERVQASKNAEAAERERAETAIRLAEEELRILVARQAQGETTREDLRERAELEAQLFRIQEESAEFLTTQGNKTRLLQQQIRKQEFEDVTALAVETVALAERTNEEILSGEELRAQGVTIIRNKTLDHSKAIARAEVAIQKEKNAFILGEAANLAGALGSLFGQQSEAGKLFAIADATINTWKAGVSALADTPGGALAKGLAFAAVIATGFGAVKNILGTPIPKVDIQETAFADGGFIGGRSHSRGGTWINAEKGEYMISKNRMAIPSVRRAAMSLNSYKQSGSRKYQLGGEVLSSDALLNNTLNSVINAVGNTQTVLVTSDLDAVQNRVQVTEARASI